MSQSNRSKTDIAADPWGFRLEFLQEHGQHLPNCSCENVKKQLREWRQEIELEFKATRAERDELRMTLHDVMGKFGPDQARLTLEQRASLNHANAVLKGNSAK